MDKILVFDFDGVLANTLEDMLGFAKIVCAQLGYPCQPTKEDLNALECMAFDEYARQLKIPEEKVKNFTSRMFQLFTSRKQPPDIFAGLKEVVTQLAQQTKIGIVTGNTADLVHAFVDHHDLTRYVGVVISVEEPGTRSEKIQKAVSCLGLAGAEVFVIGDAISDIHAAQLAAAKSIAVTWGHQSHEKLQAASPDFIVHSPEDLTKLLVNEPLRQP